MRTEPFVSFSQNAEDVVLCRAFAGRLGGVYVDVGAGDPIRDSVTKNLQDRLGWHGVNIEPVPEVFERLAAGRPSDVNLRVAIGSHPGTARFFKVRDAGGRVNGVDLSTLDAVVAARHKAAGWDVEAIDVSVVTLESVLRQHVEPGFDLLKIDVEGSEADVLQSFDLAYWRPRALVIEATVPDTPEPSHHAWEHLVLAAGYRFALFDGLNRFYVAQGEEELREKLSVPANVFDNWIRAGCTQQGRST